MKVAVMMMMMVGTEREGEKEHWRRVEEEGKQTRTKRH